MSPSQESYWIARYRVASRRAANAPSGRARKALEDVAKHCLALHLQLEQHAIRSRDNSPIDCLPCERVTFRSVAGCKDSEACNCR
jgi:hypothetical protein